MDKIFYKLERYQIMLKNIMYNISNFINKVKNRFDFQIKDKISKEYNYFIVGCDQVWNYNFWLKKDDHANIRFLKFLFKDGLYNEVRHLKNKKFIMNYISIFWILQ